MWVCVSAGGCLRWKISKNKQTWKPPLISLLWHYLVKHLRLVRSGKINVQIPHLINIRLQRAFIAKSTPLPPPPHTLTHSHQREHWLLHAPVRPTGLPGISNHCSTPWKTDAPCSKLKTGQCQVLKKKEKKGKKWPHPSVNSAPPGGRSSNSSILPPIFPFVC